MSRRSRVLRRILLLALAVYLICSVAAVQVMNAALFGRADEPDGLTVRYADVAADYPRQTVTFSSGSAQLTGWLYPAEDAAALVVIAHGLGADAETYLPETMHFVDSGYIVLTYDATGTGASGGSGTRGLAQSALDLDAALTRAEQESLPILLFGHSWGGYAAAAVLGGSHDVTASVCAAGFDTPLGLMRQTARRWCGPVAELGVPFLWIDQRLRFGAAADISGAKAAAASGVPVLSALSIVKETSGNEVVAKGIQKVHDAVKEGEGIAAPLSATKIFPEMVISMVEVGEETGKLPEMLDKIANTYDEEVDNAVSALTSMIEPLMIVGLAVIVGGIVVALFAPLVKIIEKMS